MNPAAFRVAVGLYVAILVGLIAAYISVSLVNVQVAAYIQGPQALIQGGPNAIRGFIMNAPTGQLFTGAETRFVLNPGPGQLIAGTGETQKHGYVHTTLDVSTVQAGPHKLEVDAKHPLIDEFVASTSVTVVPEPTTRPWEIATSRQSRGPEVLSKEKSSDWKGDLTVEPIGPNRELARGLKNLVTLRVVDGEGLPVQAKVTFIKLEGPTEGELPKELTTDEFGLATLQAQPIDSMRWTLRADEVAEPHRSGEGSILFSSVASQFSLEMVKNFLAPGESVEGKVTTLHRSGGLMVDLYGGQRWVFADAYGITPNGAGLRVEAPTSVKPKLWRVQVYDDVFSPGNAWDAQWLAVSTDGTCRSAIDPTLTLLAATPRHARFVEGVRKVMVAGKPLSEIQCNDLLGALLRGFPPHFDEPTLLVNSKAGEEQDLEIWKEQVKRWLHVLIAIALLVAFSVVMVFVAQGVATSQRQQRAIELADLETDGDGFDTSKWDRIAHVGRAVLFIGTIFLFGAGLLMVLTFM
ncbi:MAG: hypothetical protein R3E66_00420 [bacterium]